MNVKSIAFACCPSVLKPMLNRIENSPLGYRLAKGVFWSMAGTVISRSLMLVAAILVGRILGKDVFGEYNMVRNTVGMLGIFTGFALSLTAIKHVAEFRHSDPERAGRIIGITGIFAMLAGGLMSLGLFIFAPWLAEHTINAPHLAGVLRIGAIILFVNSLNGAQTGALSGFEAFKTIAYVNLFVGLISFPILVCGAYFGGLTGAFWGLAINLGFNWLLNHIALRKEAHRHNVPFSLKNCTSEMTVLWAFSLPALLSGILASPVLWVCNTMLFNRPEGHGEMGILSAALVFQPMMLYLGAQISMPLLSMLSNVKNDASNKMKTVNLISTWMIGAFLAIPLLSLPEIPAIMFGKEFAGPSLQYTYAIVVFFCYLGMFRDGVTRLLAANSLMWWGFGNNLLSACILLPLAFFLTAWGAVGLAASLTITRMITTVVFIPFIVNRGLVPKGILISKEACLISAVIIGLTISVFWEIPVAIRLIAMPLAMILVGFAFKTMWQQNTTDG